MNYVFVYPQHIFEDICIFNDWNDENISTNPYYAIISINDYDEPKHYFHTPHHNVLNLEFADVGSTGYRPITADQLMCLYNFILSNTGKDFLIHCVAGQSRSVAIGKFITEHIDGYNITYSNLKGKFLTPNMYIYNSLVMLKDQKS